MDVADIAKVVAATLTQVLPNGTLLGQQQQSASLSSPAQIKTWAAEFLAAHENRWCAGYYRNNKMYLERWDGRVDRTSLSQHFKLLAAAKGKTAPGGDRACISAFVNWCVVQGYLETAPAIPLSSRLSKARERVLEMDELMRVWKALEDDHYGRIVKLLILTLARKSEIGSLRYEEIRDDRIVIPVARSKNRREHHIPLTDQMRQLLPPQRKGNPYVFGRRRNKPFSGYSKCKTELDKRLSVKGKPRMAPWVIHDLRRSGATHLAEGGYDADLVELALNHVSGRSGVRGVYNRSVRWAARVEMLEKWSELIAKAVAKV